MRCVGETIGGVSEHGYREEAICLTGRGATFNKFSSPLALKEFVDGCRNY